MFLGQWLCWSQEWNSTRQHQQTPVHLTACCQGCRDGLEVLLLQAQGHKERPSDPAAAPWAPPESDVLKGLRRTRGNMASTCAGMSLKSWPKAKYELIGKEGPGLVGERETPSNSRWSAQPSSSKETHLRVTLPSARLSSQTDTGLEAESAASLQVCRGLLLLLTVQPERVQEVRVSSHDQTLMPKFLFTISSASVSYLFCSLYLYSSSTSCSVWVLVWLPISFSCHFSG